MINAKQNSKIPYLPIRWAVSYVMTIITNRMNKDNPIVLNIFPDCVSIVNDLKSVYFIYQ